ncbi:MAG: class I SAM-dependent methyltransferase [Bacteroidia bacterium]
MAYKTYHSQTNYKDVEDFKRLDFIVNEIAKINNPNAKILDIGCGNGNISLALGSLGYNVKGIDIDETSVKTASSRNKFSNVSFEVYDANQFEMGDIFDAIVCSEVLEHLITPEQLVKSILKILKPGGIFVATVPNGLGPREVLITKPMQWLTKNKFDGPINFIKKLLGYNATTHQSSNPDLTHIQFFTVGSFKKLIGGNGFKLISFKNADFIERIFPYSFLTRRLRFLQTLDCFIADFLPKQLTCGFYTSWTKPK